MSRRIIACVAALALSIGIALGTLSAQAATACTPQSSWGTLDGGLAAQIVTLVNQHRSNMTPPLSPLQGNSALSASADWKSLNMAGLDYFDHNDLSPARTVAQRLADCGFAGSTWGENIAVGSRGIDAMTIFNGWLASPGHLANIEGAAYTVTGVGVAVQPGSGTTYWTQEFGTGGGSVVTAPPPPAPAPVTPPVAPTAPPAAPATPPSPPASPSSPGVSPAPAAPVITVAPAPQPAHARTKGISIADRVHAPMARAGERFTASLPIAGTDAAAVHCTATVGQTSLATHDGRFVQGKAICSWHPKSSMRGLSLTGRITVESDGQTVWAQFSRYVRAHR